MIEINIVFDILFNTRYKKKQRTDGTDKNN